MPLFVELAQNDELYTQWEPKVKVLGVFDTYNLGLTFSQVFPLQLRSRAFAAMGSATSALTEHSGGLTKDVLHDSMSLEKL